MGDDEIRARDERVRGLDVDAASAQVLVGQTGQVGDERVERAAGVVEVDLGLVVEDLGDAPVADGVGEGQQGELDDSTNLDDNYVTFLASIFRSVRFGTTDAHGRANLMQLNFLEEKGAFSYDAESETYKVDSERMKSAIRDLAGVILKFHGDGDYDGLGEFNAKYQVVTSVLEANLERLAREGIPVDVVFEQGLDVLGL